MVITYYDKSECRRPCLSDQLPESELCFPFTCIVVCSLENGSCILLSQSCVYQLIISSTHRVHLNVSPYQHKIFSSCYISLNTGSGYFSNGTSPFLAQHMCSGQNLVSAGQITDILPIISPYLTDCQLCLQPLFLCLRSYTNIHSILQASTQPSSAYARLSNIYYFTCSIFSLKYSKYLQTQGQKVFLIAQQMTFLLNDDPYR